MFCPLRKCARPNLDAVYIAQRNIRKAGGHAHPWRLKQRALTQTYCQTGSAGFSDEYSGVGV